MKHKPYQLTDTERKMLFKMVDTPEGTGQAVNIYRSAIEVDINGRKEYFPKDQVSLSTIQFTNTPIELTSEYRDIWHQACLREAANTPAKKKYIFGGGSLNDYRTHEKQVHGTINA